VDAVQGAGAEVTELKRAIQQALLRTGVQLDERRVNEAAEQRMETRFCKDCVHARIRHYDGYSEWRCARIEGCEPDLVTGETHKTPNRLCQHERQANCYCGPEAKYFEPLPTPTAVAA
jgi:hypothetical protein